MDVTEILRPTLNVLQACQASPQQDARRVALYHPTKGSAWGSAGAETSVEPKAMGHFTGFHAR